MPNILLRTLFARFLKAVTGGRASKSNAHELQGWKDGAVTTDEACDGKGDSSTKSLKSGNDSTESSGRLVDWFGDDDAEVSMASTS